MECHTVVNRAGLTCDGKCSYWTDRQQQQHTTNAAKKLREHTCAVRATLQVLKGCGQTPSQPTWTQRAQLATNDLHFCSRPSQHTEVYRELRREDQVLGQLKGGDCSERTASTAHASAFQVTLVYCLQGAGFRPTSRQVSAVVLLHVVAADRASLSLYRGSAVL